MLPCSLSRTLPARRHIRASRSDGMRSRATPSSHGIGSMSSQRGRRVREKYPVLVTIGVMEGGVDSRRGVIVFKKTRRGEGSLSLTPARENCSRGHGQKLSRPRGSCGKARGDGILRAATQCSHHILGPGVALKKLEEKWLGGLLLGTGVAVVVHVILQLRANVRLRAPDHAPRASGRLKRRWACQSGSRSRDTARLG